MLLCERQEITARCCVRKGHGSMQGHRENYCMLPCVKEISKAGCSVRTTMYRAGPDLGSALRCALWRTRTVRESVNNQATGATDPTCFIRRPIAILSSASRDVSTGAEERAVIQACLPGGNRWGHVGRWCTRTDWPKRHLLGRPAQLLVS